MPDYSTDPKLTSEQRIPRADQRMTIEYRDPTTLTPHPENYRHHPPEQIADICRSIRASGQYKNIVVNLEDQILVGEGVTLACIEMGQPEVAVKVFDGTPEEQRRLMVADNELSRGAEDDGAQLAEHLRAIEATWGDLRGTGWTEADLKEHEAALAEEEFDPDDVEFPEYDEDIDTSGIKYATCPECGNEFPL